MPMIRLLAPAGLVAILAAHGPAFAQATKPDVFTERLAVAQARLALDMVQRLSTPNKHMVAVSPASLAGAAAALDLGASNQMRDALHTILGFRRSADSGADLAALRTSVERLAATEQGASPLKFANSIVFDDSVTLYPGVALAFKQARLDHAVLDFSSPTTADAVNKRIHEQTNGLIPEIIDRAPGGASLLVLNALHFKDRWNTPFDRANTKPAAFKRVSGVPVMVSTMHLPQGRYLFRRSPRFVGIELPYANPRFSMVIVTTRAERAAPARTFRPVGEWLTGKGFALAEGDLALPHFDVSSREDLTRALDTLGLRSARLSPNALAGFSADPARITRVMQRVELRLNEEGTETAAATAVAVERGVDPAYVRMVVDRPFVFALRDAASGLMLVAGYVAQPGTLATAAR